MEELAPDQEDESSDFEMPDDATFYKRVVRQAVEGIRPNSLRRFAAVNAVIAYECEKRHGAAFERFLDQRPPQVDRNGVRAFVMSMDAPTYFLLRESAEELLNDAEVEFLFDISERTARDYVTTLKSFYLW